ncbi:hypothetical protein Fraau_0305 [Frateuria aurantia DSM 6220]|uniref:Uncharacterized protein n=2 Tax=Frateuria aurantia TaxID=81475 RepID=H8L2G1_FRAAD|nr:hypothetical protein Fraau_0305 [Frateuria aurantia DSM 6220]
MAGGSAVFFRRHHGRACRRSASWPMHMAMGQLKNLGYLDTRQLDSASTRVVRMASEPLPGGLYQEVYHVVFQQEDGKRLEVITRSKASDQECSMGPVEVYLVNRKLQDPPANGR